MLENAGSKLAELGIDNIPRGTLDELRKEGLDPGLVASCHPNQPGIRGCAQWADCLGHRKEHGGYKGKGPINLAYFMQTNEGDVKEDSCTCHGFIRSGVQARMMEGIVQQMKGDPMAEVIEIVALEPGIDPAWPSTYTRKVWTQTNPNPADKEGVGNFVEDIKTVDVPKHPRPGESKGATYNDLIRSKYNARKAARLSNVEKVERLTLETAKSSEAEVAAMTATPVATVAATPAKAKP